MGNQREYVKRGGFSQYLYEDHKRFKPQTVNGIRGKAVHYIKDGDTDHTGLPAYADTSDMYFRVGKEGNVIQGKVYIDRKQSIGFNVIQTASWGNANSFSYCFEGLAEHSVTAVCGIGHDHCPQAKHLWQYAIQKLVDEKSPTKLIVYGGKQDELPKLDIPVHYFEDHITKHFRYDSK